MAEVAETLGADVVVVGGGIAGLSVAAAVAACGAEVVLIEAEEALATHTTGRSAAVFVPGYGPPAQRALAAASWSWFTEQALLSPRGLMVLARPDQHDALRRRAGDHPDARLLDATSARDVVPGLRPDYLVGAILDERCWDIDVHGTLSRFRAQARRCGARLLTGASLGAARHTTHGWSVSAGAHRVRASVLVNAAGAWADEVARRSGVRPVGLEPRRRTLCTVDAPPTCEARRWPLLLDVDEEFYVKPEGPHLLVSPADATPAPPGDARPEELDVAQGLDRAGAALEGLGRHVRAAWAGLRTFAPDAEPVLGPDPLEPAFVWAAGQGGTGIQTAPAMAALVATAAGGEDVAVVAASWALPAGALTPERLR